MYVVTPLPANRWPFITVPESSQALSARLWCENYLGLKFALGIEISDT